MRAAVSDIPSVAVRRVKNLLEPHPPADQISLQDRVVKPGIPAQNSPPI
jgi:hypothetical protein